MEQKDPVEQAEDARPGDEAAAEPEPPEDNGAAPEEISADDLVLEEKASDADAEADQLRAKVEAAVYITEEPLAAKQLAEALEEPLEKVLAALDSLVEEYEQPRHGLVIRQVAEGYKMGTKAEYHESLRAFVKKLQKPLKLSMAALETLAVISYKQPITAPEILEIRGVQGTGVLKTLLDRKLITTAGRKNVVGKPMLYRTTKEFLVQFGLKNLKELPTLKEFEELARVALADAEEAEEGPRQQELLPAGAEADPEGAGDSEGDNAPEAEATEDREPENEPAGEPGNAASVDEESSPEPEEAEESAEEKPPAAEG